MICGGNRAPVATTISAYDGIRWGPGLPRQFQYEIAEPYRGTLWERPMQRPLKIRRSSAWTA